MEQVLEGSCDLNHLELAVYTVSSRVSQYSLEHVKYPTELCEFVVVPLGTYKHNLVTTCLGKRPAKLFLISSFLDSNTRVDPGDQKRP